MFYSILNDSFLTYKALGTALKMQLYSKVKKIKHPNDPVVVQTSVWATLSWESGFVNGLGLISTGTSELGEMKRLEQQGRRLLFLNAVQMWTGEVLEVL